MRAEGDTGLGEDDVFWNLWGPDRAFLPKERQPSRAPDPFFVNQNYKTHRDENPACGIALPHPALFASGA